MKIRNLCLSQMASYLDPRALTGPVMLALLLVSSCATITDRPPVVTSKEVGKATTEQQTKEAVAELTQEGGLILSVRARHACEVREQTRLVRTTVVEKENKTASADVVALGVGAGCALAGAIVVADSGNVYDDNNSSRTYNPVGPGSAKAIGWGLVGVGSALLLVPVIDAIRASGSTVDTTKVSQIGKVVQGAKCKGAPYAEATVTLETKGAAFDIGTTDDKGELDVDLAEAVPEHAELRSDQPEARILVGGFPVGTASLEALFVKREAEAWGRVMPSCRRAPSDTSCLPVKAFVTRYPNGPHFKEAQSLLDTLAAQNAARAEAQLWSTLNLPGCRDPKGKLEILRTHCSRLESYLTNFPDGPHAADVKDAYAEGKERIDKLEAKKEEDEEKARKKAEADAKAAEKRAADREKAAERRELEEQRAICRAQCQMGCSGWQFRHNPEACMSGCVRARCQQ